MSTFFIFKKLTVTLKTESDKFLTGCGWQMP